MAIRRTPVVMSPEDDTVLGEYVTALNGHLRGPARSRSRILDEIRSGLQEATDAYRSRGMTGPEAARAAIADLGASATVAAAFAGELATRRARHILWTLLLTGPLVGIWWFLLLAPPPWSAQPESLVAAIPVLPLIAAAVGIAVVAIATTGSLIRWLPETAPKRALAVTIAVALCCIVGDVTVVAILGVRSAAGSTFPLIIAVAAVAASLSRLVFAGWAVRECLRVRVSLPRDT